MNHYFAIIDDKKILKIINNLQFDKKLTIQDKIYLKKTFFEYNYKMFNTFPLDDEIFRKLNYVEFECFTNNKFFRSNTFNYYGITLIPFYSLEIVKKSFLNITIEEECRLNDINITIDEYRKIIKDIVNLFDSALIEKKAVVHFGI